MCDYCEKYFKSKQSMWRHKRLYCNIKKKQYHNINELKNIVLEQKNQINNLINKLGTTTTITNNNIENMNQIQLNNYGQEDLSYLTNGFKTELIKGPYGMIPKMIEAVHFNPKKPQNKNILLPNKNDNKIKIFSNNKWIYKDKTIAINDLVDGNYFILDTHYDNICNEGLNHGIKNIYEKFRNLFDDKDKQLHGNIVKECELVILNNR